MVVCVKGFQTIGSYSKSGL